MAQRDDKNNNKAQSEIKIVLASLRLSGKKIIKHIIITTEELNKISRIILHSSIEVLIMSK